MPRSCLSSQDGIFHIVPVCHYRGEFAGLVRQAYQEVKPDRVAIELPNFLGPGLQKAVNRFPQLSILSYEVEGGQTMVLPIEPTDPFAEAARSAAQEGKPVHYIDLHVQGYQPNQDWVPDSASLTAIGFEAWWGEWEKVDRRSQAPQDLEREGHMVQNLRSLRQLYPQSRFLVICGAMHALNILQGLNLENWESRSFEEVAPPAEVVLYQPDLDSARQISCEIPLYMTIYELNRGGEGPESTWQAPPQAEPPQEPEPSPLADLSKQEVFDSISALLGMKKKIKSPSLKSSHLKSVAEYLTRLQQKPLVLSDLLDSIRDSSSAEDIKLPHLPPAPRVKAFTFRQMDDRRGELLALYRHILEHCGLDRHRILVQAVEHASLFYKENTGDTIVRWQKDVLFQFLRNYASLKGRLLPGVFEMIMGARGVADDNFSYEIWDLLTFYPWAELDPDVPALRIDADQLFLGGRRVHEWTFHRRLPRLRQVSQRIPVKKRAEEEKSGEWAEDFNKGTLCSYPPEDLVIEDYGRYLQKKAVSMLSMEKTRVEPFSTTILDGIDMRETLRNWHEKTIYVKESQRITGGVGAVVIIFDHDAGDGRYPWKMTWHGEHAQESDMSFYATPIQNKIVGPGIARCEYGGLMLSYPNRRLSDVWTDPYYAGCQSKAEVLLMAALDYSLEKHIVYVAAQPPRSTFKSVAGKLGRKIVYIPIGQLSPQSLKKIRVFHVLSGHRLRKIAKDYIW